MTTILLLGHGQIGAAIERDLAEYSVRLWKHDIADLTTSELDVIAPDVVINAAGKTQLSWCEEHAREAVRVNLEAPVELYRRIREYDRTRGHQTRFIHFSSGCVWDGPFDEQGQPFSPSAPPTPACLYSWTKAAADAMLLDLDQEHIAILRPRQVYSETLSPRNTLVKLLQYERLIDTPNSVTSMRVIERMLRYVITAEQDWAGLWNVYDREATTPYAIGMMLHEAGLRSEPKPLTKSELDTFHHPKRVDTVLYDPRFEQRIAPEHSSVELRQAIDGLKLALEHALELERRTEQTSQA